MIENDPDRLLDEMAGLLRMARSLSHGASVELFHRFSLRRRAHLEPDGSSHGSLTGEEDGLAIRLRPVGHRGGAFAATSGRGEEAVAWAVEQARGLVRWRSERDDWATGGKEPVLDRDPGGFAAMPTNEALLDWLREANGGSSWAEAAVTVETLVSDQGVRASRTRLRVWALFRTETNNIERFQLFAARSLERLPRPDAELRQAGAPGISNPASLADLPVIFEPEPAARLGRALVGAFHVRGTAGAPVGAGWCVTDDPTDPAGVAGGRIDDAGFPTRKTTLADGKTVVGVLDGPGHLWRPSFRDPPEPVPTTIVVAPPAVECPQEAWLVTGLRVHPADECWVLEMNGAKLVGGRIATPFERIYAPFRPESLLAGIEAGLGEPVRSGVGVVTPALVLRV